MPGVRAIAILPGQYLDAETGLHQNWHRDYDRTTGRYLASDPLGLLGGPSTYGYSYQSPIRYADPLGLWSVADAFPANAPIALAGQAIAAEAAYLHGLAAGDEALMSVALEGMGEARDSNTEAVMVLATLGRGRPRAANVAGSCPKPSDVQGKTMAEVAEMMAARGWRGEPTSRGGGTRYPSPEKKGEQVRVQP